MKKFEELAELEVLSRAILLEVLKWCSSCFSNKVGDFDPYHFRSKVGEVFEFGRGCLRAKEELKF